MTIAIYQGIVKMNTRGDVEEIVAVTRIGTFDESYDECGEPDGEDTLELATGFAQGAASKLIGKRYRTILGDGGDWRFGNRDANGNRKAVWTEYE